MRCAACGTELSDPQQFCPICGVRVVGTARVANPLVRVIEQVSQEKHIEPEIIFAAMEDAMVAAAQKHYKTEENFRAKIRRETGDINVYAVRAVVAEVSDTRTQVALAEARKSDHTIKVGGELLIPKPTEGLGPVVAQTAKQVIAEKVLAAKPDVILNANNRRVGSQCRA
jgi:transcription termination/antitermination protein NusA